MNTQAQFFRRLKPTVSPFSSLAAEVAITLNVSLDSAYRRIRGEKLLDFNEISLLCQGFNVSVDEFFCLNSSAILFQSGTKPSQKDALKQWMEDVYKQLYYINSYPNRHLYHLIKDLPPFHHFFHPVLARFKFFFWRKSILPPGQAQLEKFCLNQKQLFNYEELSQRIIRAYAKVPSTEIWNKDALNTTLRQIETYHEMGWIENRETTKMIYLSVLDVIEHLEKMATHGQKSLMGQSPTSEHGEYRLYLNDIVSGDNTLLVELGESKITYLNHSVLYFVGSKDPEFNEVVFRNMENVINKSSLMSGSGEKERTQVFNTLRKKVYLKLEAMDLSPKN
jgi:hypothetical protein